MSALVDERRLTTLPLSGRDFTQLALLQPGVVSARNSRVNASKGFGTRISIAGSRPDQTGWLLDGMNIKSFSNFGTPGSASGLLLGVDAVQEFQVVSANFSAEFGGNSGGIINMVTKSGTNAFHGTAYEFHRNDAMDTRNFFDRTKPDLKRNQFGFSIGGPIHRNRTFFFGNYEVFREQLGLTRVAVVPDANAHQGLVPTSSGALQQVQIAPSIRPILDAWPLPNGSPVGTNSGLAELLSPAIDRTDQDYFMTRLDHRLTDNQSLFGRFTYDEGIRRSPAQVPVHNSDSVSGSRYGTVQHMRIWTPRLLSTTRVGFSRNRLGQDVSLNQELPAGVFFLSKTVLHP